MKVLVIGNGGREHALAWRLARGASITEVFCAPGNAGTALEPGVRNLPLTEDDALLAFAKREGVGLVVIGPEAPLAAGLADRFNDAGVPCLGPGAAGAQLEASKEHAKAFMNRHGIPTAAHRVFTSRDDAMGYLEQVGAPVVVKADGLAAGKGVVVASTLAEAREAVDDMLGGRFGDAGHRVVIESFLEGEEASFIVLTDGKTTVPLASSQDHKARDEGDKGPNTGGMGAYSPAPVVTARVNARVMETVIRPAIEGLAKDGVDFRGFLYAGLMIDAKGEAKVLEFNCRLGDPETQPILMRLRSDLGALCLAAAQGRLEPLAAQVSWDPRTALGVVLASRGYPGDYPKGSPIMNLPDPPGAEDEVDAKVFHAGTQLREEQVVSSGGRVLCAVGLGECVAQAAQLAYELTERIEWVDKYYRRDIGHRAMQR
ncbi:MAG: phosphoribosylamine--glycine ligase [Pseudomonadota bacterium]